LSGYSNRIVHVAFPELSEEDDPIWLSIRNPRYMAPSELRPKDLPVGDDGKPLDNEAAQAAMYEVYAKLIVGWRVYDPTTIAVDPETGAPLNPHFKRKALWATVVAAVCWVIFYFAIGFGASHQWWLILSPVLMTFLLLQVSGVTLLEEKIDERRPGYADYKRRVSAFVPWPPKKL